ncbi:MAG: armadillo/beta-catenin-like repeat-containing protein [Planctomycetes bacterium]|nr:armadillo/beta-catenin-like repeat-containing protein [Planctomycetota bacterium]
MYSYTSRMIGALLVAALALGAAPARAETPNVERILSAVTNPSPGSIAVIARQLVELGPAADTKLFEALAHELSLGHQEPSARTTVMLAAFELMGPGRWRTVLTSKMDAAPASSAIAALFAVSGQAGNGDDLPLMFYAAGYDPEGDHRSEFEAATTRILLHDPAAFNVVDSAVQTLVPEIRSSLVRALEKTKKPVAARLLARWIETRREMRLECLPYLSRLSLSLDRPLPVEVTGPVRALVESGDETTLREAVVCIGRLVDWDAIPALIRCMKDGDYGMRKDALWALRNMTGLKLSETPTEWSKWFESEVRWWSVESRKAFTALVHGSKADKVATLRAVNLLHAWRERAASEIAIALDDVDTDIALLTVAELQRLDSKAAVPALVDALFGGRLEVATAAHAALESITRRELPEEPLACRELLFPGS